MTPALADAPDVLSPQSASDLIASGRAAQDLVKDWPQRRVDQAVAAVGWALSQDATARRLTSVAVTETALGDFEDSLQRLHSRIRGALSDMHGVETLGLFDEDPRKGLQRYAKPIGVIAAMTPMTAPIAAIAVNSLTALKTRNAIIVCPNPGAAATGRETVAVIREALAAVDAPADLVQVVAEPDWASATELAGGCDLVVATGGASAVRRIAASGKPAYVGGPGNAVVVVDETADFARAADAILSGKSFDNGSSCSAESCLIVTRGAVAATREALAARGAYFCGPAETARLRATVWPEGKLSRAAVARPAGTIAAFAGLDAPSGTRILVAEIDDVSEHDPICGEKLTPILGFLSCEDFDEAVALVLSLTEIAGRGHSCGVHTRVPERVARLASAAKVSRVMVNQSTGGGNTGSSENGMPFTTTVSCGPWGGAVTNENLNWRHFLNYSWVSHPIERQMPSWEELMEPYRSAAPETSRDMKLDDSI